MTIQFDLPADLQEQLREKAEKNGCTVEAYLQRMVCEHLVEDIEVPAHLSPRSHAELKKMVEDGVNSPSEEFTRKDFEEFKRDVVRRARERRSS